MRFVGEGPPKGVGPQFPDTRDYTAMEGPQLLSELRDDAMSWAIAFNQHAAKLGYQPMDEGWLVGWFANAIENSHDVRTRRSKPETSPAVLRFPS